MIKRTIKKIKDRINGLNLPATLLKNFVRITSVELQSVREKTAIERQWYHEVKPFETIDEILSSEKLGHLVKITSTRNYNPIIRLQNQKLISKYPPFLTPYARNLLEEIASRWRSSCDEAKIDTKIRLAITSLVRTVSYQNILIKSGKLAMPDSPHLRGEAFDIDASGYYLGETPINPRVNEQEEFKKAFADLDATINSPSFGDYKIYDPEVHEILKRILKKMREEGKINFVYEYPHTTNACFHICRNPEYLA